MSSSRCSPTTASSQSSVAGSGNGGRTRTLPLHPHPLPQPRPDRRHCVALKWKRTVGWGACGPRRGGVVVSPADHRVVRGTLAHPSRRKEMDSPAHVRRVAGGAGKQAAMGNVQDVCRLYLPPSASFRLLARPGQLRPGPGRWEGLATPYSEPRTDLHRQLCSHNWGEGGP